MQFAHRAVTIAAARQASLRRRLPKSRIVQRRFVRSQDAIQRVLCEKDAQRRRIAGSEGMHQALPHRLEVGLGARHLVLKLFDGARFALAEELFNLGEGDFGAGFAFDAIALQPVSQTTR